MELTEIPHHWRDLAINEVLRTNGSEGAYPPHTILQQIRTYMPGCFSVLFHHDRLQLLKFLQEEATGFRSLVSGGDSQLQRGEFCPYTGWYAVEWEGTTVEIAMAPGPRNHSCAIAFSRDEAALHRFGLMLDDYAVRPAGRCLTFSRLWESAPELDAEIGKVTWGDIILPAKVLEEIREAVEGFVKHRDAFTTLGFPWRRGLLLVGPPGTGKTMLCKAAAAALPELPFLYIRDFHGDPRVSSQGAVQTIFERARKLAPCLLAFEDIDGMVTSNNRSLFLNELDGFQENNGLLIIASSNHPGKIDEALLKRPSRFDRVFHIGLPALAERRIYCRRLLSRSTLAARIASDLDTESLAQEVAVRSDGFTPAYLKEAFVSAALQQAQEGMDLLDQHFAETVLVQVEELRHQLQMMKSPDALGDFADPETAHLGLRRNRA